MKRLLWLAAWYAGAALERGLTALKNRLEQLEEQ